MRKDGSFISLTFVAVPRLAPCYLLVASPLLCITHYWSSEASRSMIQLPQVSLSSYVPALLHVLEHMHISANLFLSLVA